MKTKKKIFVICPVRIADDATRRKLEAYKKKLEAEGHEVHMPHLDTNQEAGTYAICVQNMNAMLGADEIHIFFNPASYGTHFDLGMTFLACHLDADKIIKVIENLEICGEDGQIKAVLFNSFSQLLEHWEKGQEEKIAVK